MTLLIGYIWNDQHDTAIVYIPTQSCFVYFFHNV